jgi:hypothetical protein
LLGNVTAGGAQAGTATAAGLTAGIYNIQNVFGGSAGDTIAGNNQNNILAGNGGNDVITGGPARSILTGGSGADRVTGGADDDIVIASTTAFDTTLTGNLTATLTALTAILTEWVRTDVSYNGRVNDVMVGGASGLNGPYVLYKGSSATGTVFDDTSADSLAGGPGSDLFFLDFQTATATDKVSGEKLVNLSNTAGDNKALLSDSAVAGGDALPLLNSPADLYTGPMFVSIRSDDGSAVPPDVRARLEDALGYWGQQLADEGLSFIVVAPDTPATDISIHLGTSSPVGGLADGVLGCTSPDGTINLIRGWNWYSGSDPAQVGAGQYDLQTIATHELGHSLGLGHSADEASVMYPYLATGEARRALSTGDVATLGRELAGGSEALLAAGFAGTGRAGQPAVGTAPAPALGVLAGDLAAGAGGGDHVWVVRAGGPGAGRVPEPAAVPAGTPAPTDLGSKAALADAFFAVGEKVSPSADVDALFTLPGDDPTTPARDPADGDN